MGEITVQDFSGGSSVSAAGRLTTSAGAFSRAAIITVFELNGGVEAMAEWAEANKTEFYTKLFPKLVGRETPDVSKPDDVEDLLDTIDLEATDITDEAPEQDEEESAAPVGGSDLRTRLAKRAAACVESEAA